MRTQHPTRLRPEPTPNPGQSTMEDPCSLRAQETRDDSEGRGAKPLHEKHQDGSESYSSGATPAPTSSPELDPDRETTEEANLKEANPGCHGMQHVLAERRKTRHEERRGGEKEKKERERRS